MATIVKSNLIVPEVLGAILEQKMIDNIRIAPLAIINTELQGNAGDEISVPQYSYIGDAVDLAENTAGELDLLTATTVKAKVKKAFKGVEITDEARGASFGNPLAEAERQLAVAMASKVEKDCITAVEASENTFDGSNGGTEEISPDKLADGAVALYGEDFEGVFALITPKQYNVIRKNIAFTTVANGEAFLTGHVGQVYGVQIVVSNRITAGKVPMLKVGGLQIVLKKEVAVETDRDILKKTTVITADRHYVAHILDGNKVGIMTVKATV